MSVVAAIRPDEVNLPLFLHVLGAMLLVGTLLTAATALVLSWRTDGDTIGLARFGLRALLFAAFPSWLLMRVTAQWTEAEENLPEEVEESTWLGIGYITAEAGGLLIVISMILSAIGLRKLRSGGGAGLGRAVGIISLLLLAAYVVAIWAMSAKPD